MQTDVASYAAGCLLFITPSLNSGCEATAQLYLCYLSPLPPGRSASFRSLSLEDCISILSIVGDGEFGAWLFERYLDFSPVTALVEEWLNQPPGAVSQKRRI